MLKRDHNLKHWLEEFFNLKAKYLNKITPESARDKYLEKLWIFTALLLITHTVSMLVLIHGNYKATTLLLTLNVYFDFNVISNQQLLMLHHSSILCSINQCFSKLNYQLKCEDINNDLNLIYNSIIRLIERLNSIFEGVLLCMQLYFSIRFAFEAYMFVMFKMNSKLGWGKFSDISLYLLILIHTIAMASAKLPKKLMLFYDNLLWHPITRRFVNKYYD